MARTLVKVSGEIAVALFSRLAELHPAAPAALLDSSDHAASPTPWRSRYSILAFSLGEQAEEAVHAQGMTTVRTPQGEDPRDQPFFAWLRENWEHPDNCPSTEVGGPEETPFQLGWVGWLGYGLKRELGSPDGAASSGSSAHPAVPQQEAHLFRATHGVVIDHRAGTLEIQSLDDDPTWEQEVLAGVSDLLEADIHPLAAEPPAQIRNLRVRDSREEYLSKIRAAQEEIHSGNSYEVCLTTAVTGELDRAQDRGNHQSALSLFARLRERNRAPFTQYLRFPSRAGSVEILSTSPERHLSIEGSGSSPRTVRSEPIKGTRPRGTSTAEDEALAHDLRTHPKDRAENIMITDLVRNDLSVHAEPGTLRTERLCAVESYPTVHQMVSTVSAELAAGTHPAEAVAAAFPPGSMTGAPKISTMNILEQLESGPRGAYSGVAGYFSRTGAADLSVLIRTAIITDDGDQRRFHLGLGGAITADSDPEMEWEEVRTKAAGVLGALGAEFPGN